MRTIWKWELDEKKTISAPVGTEFLTVQMQGGKICVWGLMNRGYRSIYYPVEIVATGEDIQTNKKYIGTVQIRSNVWHIFI